MNTEKFFLVGIGISVFDSKGTLYCKYNKIIKLHSEQAETARKLGITADCKHYSKSELSSLLGALKLQVLNKNDSSSLEPTKVLPSTLPQQQTAYTLVLVQSDSPPKSIADCFLRLQAISERVCVPNSLNLEQLFALLPTLAWGEGKTVRTCDLDKNTLINSISCIDKIPRMVDFCVPSMVRIADTNRVRLGAYLQKGTTVMHEGFVNFNAGSLGACMIEGRVSSGVTIEDGTHVGGGASIMGSLSGGNKHQIQIGENCLLGANSGCGISLGDNCTIEAGLYLTAGSKVSNHDDEPDSVKNAVEYSNQNDLLFRRNSINGKVEVLKKESKFTLNNSLHAFN